MIKDRFFLLAATFFWGCAFVAQRVSTDTIGAFAFNGIRFWIGALSIVPVVWWVSRKKVPDFDVPPSFLSLPAACAILGFILFAGASLQQIGMFYTTAGKAGFITALYIVVVPILGLFLHNPLQLSHIMGCLTAVAGLYLLAFHSDGQPLNIGDLLELAGVIFWALHILIVDRFVRYYRGVYLALGQFIFCGIYNFLSMPLAGETLTWAAVLASAIPILYCGIFSSGVGYTLQIVGQEHVPPTEASLLLSCEMIFSALAGFFILGESMTLRELSGCILMSIGIFAAQIPSRIVFNPGRNETSPDR